MPKFIVSDDGYATLPLLDSKAVKNLTAYWVLGPEESKKDEP